MCIRHFSYICNRDSHFRSSAKAQRSKNTIFTNNSKSPNTMRFFQFFTFEIIKSKKIFRRNLFEPENELPQLPTNNNYDEQFLSFFQQCFELVCPKKDGTANIYKAETMGKQEGFLLGRIADNRTKGTINEEFEKEIHDDHPFCFFIVDTRHHLLAIERGTAFSHKPERVADIFQEAFGQKLADSYMLDIQIKALIANNATQFWPTIEQIMKVHKDRVKYFRLDFKDDEKPIDHDDTSNNIAYLMASAARSMDGNAFMQIEAKYNKEGGLDLKQGYENITRMLNICMTENSPYFLCVQFKKFGLYRVGEELIAQFGLENDDALDYFRIQSNHNNADQPKDLNHFALAEWMDTNAAIFKEYVQRPLTRSNKRRKN